MNASERIAARVAAEKPLRILLSVLAAPFYVLGFLAGLVVVVLMWFWVAAGVGFTDVRARAEGDS